MADRNAPASFTFEEWRVEFNRLATDLGDIANLPSTVNGVAVTDALEAIKELQNGLSTVLLPNVIDFEDSTSASAYRIKMGISDDLQLYHDASNSIIKHDGTGTLNVDSTSGVKLQFNGSTKLTTDTNGIQVTGNVHASGNITADGNITLGDGDTDSVTFNADLTSNIVPNATNTYDLGESGKEWRNLYINGALIDENGISMSHPTTGGVMATEGFSIAIGVALG
jgi:hypothetical protein